MLVVRANDFSIPSDENDYDELVAFADTMASIEQFEAIPKADYEARLRAEKIAVLEELKTEIEKAIKEEESFDYKLASGLRYSEKIIQDRIDKLKGQ